MLLLKFLLLATGFGLFTAAAAIVIYDIYTATRQWRLLAPPPDTTGQGAGETAGRRRDFPGSRAIRWRTAGKLAALAWLPLLLGLSIVVVPSGMAGVRASQIDSKAELERRKLLAEAEATRIRLTSAADAERMKMEALVLKQNPLLIQKIIAERLSDKVQIMMVPMDGKFFFANDVLRGAQITTGPAEPDDPDGPPRKPNGRP